MRQFKWENVQECINELAQYEQDQNAHNETASLSRFYFQYSARQSAHSRAAALMQRQAAANDFA